jgi:hypothetical protein
MNTGCGNPVKRHIYCFAHFQVLFHLSIAQILAVNIESHQKAHIGRAEALIANGGNNVYRIPLHRVLRRPGNVRDREIRAVFINANHH